MSDQPIITFIGAGNMAEAILGGLLESGLCQAAQLRASDPNGERRSHFESSFGISTFTDNALAVEGSDVIVLAVKPQMMDAVLPPLASSVSPDAMILSIAAGLTCKRLESYFGPNTRLVRSMPNTPALVKRGMAGICAGTHATEADLELAEALLGSVGAVVRVEEPGIDQVTALSGSGPAYVFYMVEHLMRAGSELGMDPEISRKLVVEMIAGAAELLQETGLPAETLRARVTSKGGTTAAAIATFDEHGVGDGIHAGALAAHARSLELSQV